MPRNAVTKHILTIYIHVCLVSSITRFRRQSVPWTPCAEIHWHKLKKEIHRSSDTSCCAWSPESPLQLNKTWFCGSLFKKLKLCLSLWHAHRNSSCSKDGFSATCWSCSNLTEKAAIFDLAILARRSRRVSLGDVTAHGRVQDWPRREHLGTRLAQTIAIIIGLFITLWSPSFILSSIQTFFANACLKIKLKQRWFWTALVAFSNSAVNPWVYALRGEEFRSAFRKLLRRGDKNLHLSLYNEKTETRQSKKITNRLCTGKLTWKAQVI